MSLSSFLKRLAGSPPRRAFVLPRDIPVLPATSSPVFALQAVLAAYGTPRSVEQLEVECAAEDDLISIDQMVEVARRYGVPGRRPLSHPSTRSCRRCGSR